MFTSGFPEQTIGPAALAPNRNATFPASKNIDFVRCSRSADLAGDQPRATVGSPTTLRSGSIRKSQMSAPAPSTAALTRNGATQ